MVHNGIEYGDMQLICEAYHLMKDVLEMNHDEMAQVSDLITLLLFVFFLPPSLMTCGISCDRIQAFDAWNKTELDSFLIEITANILKYRDSDNTHLLPKIRDSAGQKGTGKWTAISALEYGTPVTLIGKVSDKEVSSFGFCHDDIAKIITSHGKISTWFTEITSLSDENFLLCSVSNRRLRQNVINTQPLRRFEGFSLSLLMSSDIRGICVLSAALHFALAA